MKRGEMEFLGQDSQKWAQEIRFSAENMEQKWNNTRGLVRVKDPNVTQAHIVRVTALSNNLPHEDAW